MNELINILEIYLKDYDFANVIGNSVEINISGIESSSNNNFYTLMQIFHIIGMHNWINKTYKTKIENDNIFIIFDIHNYITNYK